MAYKKYLAACILGLIMMLTVGRNITVFAIATNTPKYYFSDIVNAGKDTGYSETNKVDKDDPHYGWSLGSFYVDGYTRKTEDAAGTPIFLKNVGDTVTLWFDLEQDIDKLNGNEDLSISIDENGYDEYFNLGEQNFARGTLVIKYTDYQNKKATPVVYTNYLEANVEKGASTEVRLCEEGDYEVALNYEIKNNPRKIFGISIVPTYTNYRLHFKFSVRNGNCMVYPFDVATNDELGNTEFTENGFYLDKAKSRYLDIDVKKDILIEGPDGFSWDTRFNRPAKDGEKYTDEGVYTITVINKYTEQQTTKKIYVGTNELLKAHVTTGLSVQEIKKQVDNGAKINEDGTIRTSAQLIAHPGDTEYVSAENVSKEVIFEEKEKEPAKSETATVIGIVVCLVIVVCSIAYYIVSNNKKRLSVPSTEVETKEGKDK